MTKTTGVGVHGSLQLDIAIFVIGMALVAEQGSQPASESLSWMRKAVEIDTCQSLYTENKVGPQGMCPLSFYDALRNMENLR